MPKHQGVRGGAYGRTLRRSVCPESAIELIVPIACIIRQHFLENSDNHLVTSFCLTIRLGIIRGRMQKLNSKVSHQAIDLSSHERCPHVRYQTLWNAKATDDIAEDKAVNRWR